MKRLMIITQHFPPEIGAASNRLKQLVDQFQKHEVEVFVVTTKPSYPNPNLYKNESLNDEEGEKFHLYRSPIISGPFPDKVLRIMNQLLFLFFAVFMSTFVILRYSIKVFITTSPPFLVNFVGLYCKVFLKRKWVMEVRDLWPDSLLAVEALKESSGLYRLLKKFERFFYKICDRIVIVTNRTKKILVDQGVDEDKIYIVTNGIPNWILNTRLGYKNQQKSDRLNVSYIGNVGLSQNLSVLIEVADCLKNNEMIHFYIIGEGLAKRSLINETKERGLKNITFVNGTTNKEKLGEWYKIADIGIVALNNAKLFENVIPSKIFEYGACGTFILFLGKGEAAELIKTYSLGTSVEPDVEKVVKVIENYSKKAIRHELDNKKRQEFLDHYSWTSLIQKYLKVISFEKLH